MKPKNNYKQSRNKKQKNLKKFKKQIIKSTLHSKGKINRLKINIDSVKECIYFKNKICIYINDICNPYSIKCKNPNILKKKINTANKSNIIQNNRNSISSYTNEQYVKTVVLSHNRKCVYEKHNLTDTKVIIRVLTSKNKIENVVVLATHCKECNQYIILKNDFKYIKQKGTLLCRVVDKTPEYIAKHKNSSYSGTESRVHSLGYNVIKQGYNYTFTQRKIILANIIENYGITQHEILSMIDTNIARKINLPNYVDAVEKWQQDREFVSNYKLGDCPEVFIDEVVIGKRK